jgi:hypothetical protein
MTEDCVSESGVLTYYIKKSKIYMTPDELKSIMTYLRERIFIKSHENKEQVTITFNIPTEDEMIKAGLNAEGVKRILRAPWWAEMVSDIVETPEMCDPDESPEQVLDYAKDVVSEYIRKRFPLDDK